MALVILRLYFVKLLLLSQVSLETAYAESPDATSVHSLDDKHHFERPDEDVMAKMFSLDEEDVGLQALSEEVSKRYQKKSSKIIRSVPRASNSPIPAAASSLQES